MLWQIVDNAMSDQRLLPGRIHGQQIEGPECIDQIAGILRGKLPRVGGKFFATVGRSRRNHGVFSMPFLPFCLMRCLGNKEIEIQSFLLVRRLSTLDFH